MPGVGPVLILCNFLLSSSLLLLCILEVSALVLKGQARSELDLIPLQKHQRETLESWGCIASSAEISVPVLQMS